MKFSMTGEENGDLLIQVTTWAGLSVSIYITQITDLNNRMNNVSENINSLYSYALCIHISRAIDVRYDK